MIDADKRAGRKLYTYCSDCCDHACFSELEEKACSLHVRVLKASQLGDLTPKLDCLTAMQRCRGQQID